MELAMILNLFDISLCPIWAIFLIFWKMPLAEIVKVKHEIFLQFIDAKDVIEVKRHTRRKKT